MAEENTTTQNPITTQPVITPEQTANPIPPAVIVEPVIVPEARQTGKDEPYAYTITDPMFGDFRVLNSANAWWLDKGKVSDLIKAYKLDCTDEEACAYTGIRLHQLAYFKELHPEFSGVKLMCKQYPTLSARQTVVSDLSKFDNAFRYLERKRKKEFGRTMDITSGDEPLDNTVKVIYEDFSDPANVDEDLKVLEGINLIDKDDGVQGS